uniref:Uncharacterized protein n=1 Tax=Physcomitrium patens TaxID=3218 RepID=A0A2K1KXD9_PHYPA|nr:hypothetical protein PHYPA_005424 [Physcomitrium patens]
MHPINLLFSKQATSNPIPIPPTSFFNPIPSS